MSSTVKIRVSFTATIDRDVYPLPVDDGYIEDLTEDMRTHLEELDGWEFKSLKVSER